VRFSMRACLPLPWSQVASPRLPEHAKISTFWQAARGEHLYSMCGYRRPVSVGRSP
jgi:hypothetical protein